ncbi:MAG TPA: 2-amino-4-hydroxy-6-hydroxymethyldihydropteridine diphosphokinase [Longimicrobiales bacterium]|nr:2-amino-4-hydroxy-6-hydroxymethyldihydropteridine diphosphokinase [Longimicrobiales bacterium]
MARVVLGLGANLGDREGALRAALSALAPPVRIERASSVFRSDPVGYREQPDFWNLVVTGETALDPPALLARVRAIEEALGRARTFPNAPRTIDIDVLLYDALVLSTPELTLPHPRMLERAFVLRPLVELMPGERHPVTGRRFDEHLRDAEARLERAEPLFPGERFLEGEGAS